MNRTIQLICFSLILMVMGCNKDDNCDNCGDTDRRNQDSLVLVTLYTDLNGSEWVENWDVNAPMDDWFGISLDNKGRVKEIELQGNGHEGILPEELTQLSELTALEIRSGALTGGIPEGLTALTKLRFLRLDDNALSTTIPEELTQMPTLEVIDLAQNNLTGSIPEDIGLLTNLDFLDLSQNKLTGTLPVGLSELTGLVFLTLRNNNFSGCIPEQLQALCSFVSVSLFPNSQLPYEGEFEKFCGGFPQIGAPCSVVGDEGTIDSDCNCIN